MSKLSPVYVPVGSYPTQPGFVKPAGVRTTGSPFASVTVQGIKPAQHGIVQTANVAGTLVQVSKS